MPGGSSPGMAANALTGPVQIGDPPTRGSSAIVPVAAPEIAICNPLAGAILPAADPGRAGRRGSGVAARQPASSSSLVNFLIAFS